ncbi:hypothetical protein [Microscilla marina]|uniref:YcxB-like protein domain-containing protein n=1 Tax=Microscilla marina ATCC 23134 TaxID=313606 RepID=A1ZC59_MICM2|nr:hypothetical protein [Microscilla marina]EAY31861.1 hypothetical protein M23134_01890 [Microscilla marina ATCC 23134]
MMNDLDQQTLELWQTYTDSTERQFWQHYDLLKQQASVTRQHAVIQQARIIKRSRSFASTLVIAPHLKPQLDQIIKHKAPSITPLVLGISGMLLTLPFMLDKSAILLLVCLSSVVFMGSLGILIHGAKNYQKHTKLQKLMHTVLEVDEEYISGVYDQGTIEAVRFSEITTIGTEDFGLVLKTKGKDKQERNALIVPFAIEQFDKLKEHLFKQVRRNNKFVPEHQSLNVLRA